MKKILSNIWFAVKNWWNEPGNKIISFFIIAVILFTTVVFQAETHSGNPDVQIHSVFDSIWWLFVTISTVGYGDIVPKTEIGKILGILTVISGVFLFSFFSGSIASYLVDIRLKERRGLGTVNFTGHIMILGWNQNLEKIISMIPVYLGHKKFNLVLVNGGNEDDYDEIKSKYIGYNIKFIHGDFTKESVLKRGNIEDASLVIILSDIKSTSSLDETDEKTLLSVLTIRSLYPEIPIYAEVMKEDKIKHISRAGADNVIFSGEFNPVIISSAITAPEMPTFLRELIIGTESPKIKMENVPRQFIGKTFKELFDHLREKTKGIPVALLSTEKDLTIDDLLSSDSGIDVFIRTKFQEAEEDFGDEDSDKKKKVKINPDDDYKITEEDTLAFVIL